MDNNKLKIGISVGDINGIGLEVILKTLADKRILNFCTPILYGSTKVISYHKNIIKVKDLSLHNAKDMDSINPNAVNVINCWMENVKITLGKCTAEGGKYAYFSLEQAAEDLAAGELDALVTAPINKKAMQMNGFEYPGHTEYLTAKFQAKENLMLMVHENLRVGLVTNHLPISQVASTITKELVLKKIQLMNESLKMDFGIDKPAIGVLGLNPHAGDDGVLGTEDKEIILPAIEAAKQKGILAIGPYAADGFFGSGNYSNFDGILAMYHDQGLVVFKALSFGKGINFTAGLPIIRTSPDHGTGFEIAGKNAANPQSFREALYLAIDSARQREDYLEMTGNPLRTITVNEEYNEQEDKNLSEVTEDNAPSKGHPNKQGGHHKGPKSKRPQNAPQHQNNKPKKQLTIEEKLALAAAKKANKKPPHPNKKSKPTPQAKQHQKSVEKATEKPVEKPVEQKQEKEPTTPEKVDPALVIEENNIDKTNTVLEDHITEAMEPIDNLVTENNDSKKPEVAPTTEEKPTEPKEEDAPVVKEEDKA